MLNRTETLLLLAASAGIFTGCVEATSSEVAIDGPDEVAYLGGKADGQYGDCEVNAMVDWLNESTTTLETLRRAGVHTRAAKNIVKFRMGDDALLGTGDDQTFVGPKAVDDVSYVGPVAFGQLVSSVAERCIISASEAEVIFSPQPIATSHTARVAELIDGARDSIDIAMYSYRDAKIGDALERATDRGVQVRFIFESANGEHSDPAGTKSARLEDIGVDVRYVNKIMHHKFALIDGPQSVSQGVTDGGTLITGSGNWSNSAATRYDENTVIVHGNAELNLRFQKEYNHIWAHSRDFSWNDQLEFFETDTIDESSIVDEPGVDAVFTSANFRTYTSSRYGETFSGIPGKNTAADAIVAMIESAQSSIWVASGHLRSRLISNALLDAAETNPALDIRVYLDGQEYVSYSAHRRELLGQEECLVGAGTSESKRQKCLDRGYHYSYDVANAGIPLKFKYYAYRWHYSYAEQMHHKYVIVDGSRVASGSYNFSDNAEHNTLENVVFYDASLFPTVVDGFVANFQELWGTGEAEGLYDALRDDIDAATTSVPIVFESMAISWEQVRDLKRAISKACPVVNSSEYRSNAERHHTCFN